MKSKLIAPLVCAFGASVLTIVPGLKEIGCCLIIPAAAGLSLFLFQKSIGSKELITAKQAVLLGFLTGFFYAIFATGFEIFLTALFYTNDFVKSLPQVENSLRNFIPHDLTEEVFKIYKKMANDIITSGFSLVYAIYFFLATSITSLIFGIIGGLAGMAFINKRRKDIIN